MTLFENLDRRAKVLGIVDTKFVQATSMCFGIILVKLFLQILTINIGVLVGIMVACVIKPAITFCSKPANSDSA